jgi:hypothetical protein
VPLQFSVLHGQALCAPHATKEQCVAPWWCRVFLHRGDSEIECLREEIVDGDDYDRVFLEKMLQAFFHMLLHKLSTSAPGVSCQWKNTQKKYMEWWKL